MPERLRRLPSRRDTGTSIFRMMYLFGGKLRERSYDGEGCRQERQLFKADIACYKYLTLEDKGRETVKETIGVLYSNSKDRRFASSDISTMDAKS